jgi:hypothetical protein
MMAGSMMAGNNFLGRNNGCIQKLKVLLKQLQ